MVDKLLDRKKTFFWILLALVIIFRKTDSKILNKSLVFELIFYAISFLFVVVFTFLSKREELNNAKRKSIIVLNIIGGIIAILILKGLLEIPINFMLIESSKNNELQTIESPIVSVNRHKQDKLRYFFKSKIYSVYYSGIPLDYEANPDKYILVLKVKKSLFETYYIVDLKIKLRLPG